MTARFFLDLGSWQTRVATSEGIHVEVASLAAVDATKGVVASAGVSAREKVLSNSSRYSLAYPVRGGSPASIEVLSGFLRQVLSDNKIRSFSRGEVLVALNDQATALDRVSIERAVKDVGARPVNFLPDTVAAALGSGMSVDEPQGSLVVIVGERTTQAGVVSLGGLAARTSAPVGMGTLKAQIKELLRSESDLIVSDEVATEILAQLFDCNRKNHGAIAQVWGRKVQDGSSASETLSENDLFATLLPSLSKIVNVATTPLRECDTQLVADIADSGFSLVGGGAYLPGLNSYLSNVLGLECVIPEDPSLAVIRGLRAYVPLTKMTPLQI